VSGGFGGGQVGNGPCRQILAMLSDAELYQGLPMSKMLERAIAVLPGNRFVSVHESS
jgi:hypothetical protein